MLRIFRWFDDHKFETHLTIFIMIVFSSIGLFFAAQANMNPLIWTLLGVISLANIMALLIG